MERDLIAESASCAKDFAVVQAICKLSPDAARNNWAVLDCLQNPPEEIRLSPACDHYLWSFKLEVTQKARFLEQATKICTDDIDKLRMCESEATRPGHFLGCLVENKQTVENLACSQYLQRLETVIFSDYRLVANFMNACQPVVEKLGCGRVQGRAENDPHSQGGTIACLSTKIDEVDESCRKEILTIAELQASDVHLDRALFTACRGDTGKFCEGVQPGEGRIYDCLMRHKMEPDMSEACRDQISRRQSLSAQDYRIAGSLAKACKPEIKEHRCRKGVTDDRAIVKMSQIIMCLVDAKLDGATLSGNCEFEMDEYRKSLMEDYSITPEIVKDCHKEISTYCEGLGKNGKTIHCLMQASMNKGGGKGLSERCENTLHTLVREVQVESDWKADPVLEEACEEVVSAVCDPKAGKESVMSCLMEQLARESKLMTTRCREVLMQIHYFLSREVIIDENLYKSCRADAKRLCNSGDGWHRREGAPATKLVFPCLVRNLYNDDDEDDDDDDGKDGNNADENEEDDDDDDEDSDKLDPQKDSEALSPGCVDQVERVLRQRAASVQLHPEIEEVCRSFLHLHCTSHTGPGEEIGCLQDNIRLLDGECRRAVSKYTEMEARNPYLNPLVFQACDSIIGRFCGREDKARDGQGVMECLLRHKLENGPGSPEGMDGKCRHVVEHWQILTLEDWKFSFEFKEACKEEIREHCVSCQPKHADDCKGPKNKQEILECLSKIVLNDTILEQKPRVRKACRAQLKFELLQKHSSLKLDPGLEQACRLDLQKFCPNRAEVEAVECLKEQKHKQLTESCRKALFEEEEEEAVENDVDFSLMRGCKKEIKEHCTAVNASSILQCLADFSTDFNFDPKCQAILRKRIAQRMRDFRLNPSLQRACRMDIPKYCKAIILPTQSDFHEGRVIECLKEKYTQNVNLLSKPCRNEIKAVVREVGRAPSADPLTEDLCPNSLEKCKKEYNAAVLRGDNQASQDIARECLWRMFQANQLLDPEECRRHLAIVIESVSRDIHADPALNEACSIDLVKFCRDVPAGEGRRFGCLVVVSRQENFSLEPQCQSLLLARLAMYNQAVQVAPVDGALALYQTVMDSPHRNYFLTGGMVFILVVFFFGLCFGRVTKRVRQELKNR